MEHLRFLCEEVGPRPLASEPWRRAADYVRQHFEGVGLRVEEIQFPCVDWEHHDTRLELDGETLAAVANTYSPPCDLSAPTVVVSTLPELEAVDISGKVIVFTGNLSASYLIPVNCKVYNSDRDQRINYLLAERQPAAVIAVNLNPPTFETLIEDPDLLIPSATVPAEVGMRLLDHAGEVVRLYIDAERRPGQSRTLIGRWDGPTPTRITLMAHFDTKYGSPGAWDNASGMAALLSLADVLPHSDLSVGLEFIAFGDHEYYAYSDITYVEDHGDQMADILLAINFDGIGMRLGSNNISLYSASDALCQQIDETLAAYPGVVWTDPWPESNHSTFAWRGVPSIAFCTDGMRTVHHQPGDTLDWISADKVSELVALVTDLATAIQHQPAAWSRTLTTN